MQEEHCGKNTEQPCTNSRWSRGQTTKCTHSAAVLELPQDARNPIELKHDAMGIISIDGIPQRTIENANVVIGTNVHRSQLASVPIELRVRSEIPKMLNIITRAEPTAILVVLRQCKTRQE